MDVDALTDQQKIFLGVVSEMYVNLEMDTFIFFANSDLQILAEVRERFNPMEDWGRKQYPWLVENFDWMYIDEQNIGLRPKAMNHRKGRKVAGRPQHPVTITDTKCQMMWWYLLGVFNSNQVTDFAVRERGTNNIYRINKSYVHWICERVGKKNSVYKGRC